ncbi:MAG TPA: hypothetical protein VFH61_05225, partial [Thermoleophilia bacterium]|nr:hypothetical protein [Thermoleophilia bacterium]
MGGLHQTKTGGGSSQPAAEPDDGLAAAPPHLKELLALASALARDAARIHIEGRRSALSIETKSSPTDLVSQV